MASLLATLGNGPQPISRLAEQEGVAQPTLTRMVERLEAAGLVRRQRSETDGRVVIVELTDQGSLELRELRRRYRKVLTDRLSCMSDEELAGLRAAGEAIQHLAEALRDERD
jgi:DNA-binding MarR family transcriptional regulator